MNGGERVDEAGHSYPASAEDAAYALFELEDGIVAQLNSSWWVRVNRDELVELQVDGTHASRRRPSCSRWCASASRSAAELPRRTPPRTLTEACATPGCGESFRRCTGAAGASRNPPSRSSLEYSPAGPPM